MGKFTWRGWLCSAWVAVAIWLVPELHWWATALQVIGSGVTAYGFASAYLRSKYDETLIQFVRRWVPETWNRLLHGSGNVVITPCAGTIDSIMGTPGVRITATALKVDEKSPLQLQVAQIVVHLNRLTEERLPQMEDSIEAARKEVADVAGDLSTLDQRTREQIEQRFVDFDKRLDEKQVLDLGWAIMGLVITTVGTLLSF